MCLRCSIWGAVGDNQWDSVVLGLELELYQVGVGV